MAERPMPLFPAEPGGPPGAEEKLCECGCGGVPPVSPHTNKTMGYVKGQRRRFIHNHHGRLFARTPDGKKECRCCRERKPNTKEFFYQTVKGAPQPFPWSGLRPICRECDTTRGQRYDAEAAEEEAARKRDYHSGRNDDRNRFYREKSERLRREMVAAYGGMCSCCGETGVEFLTLEHRRSDGRLHQKSLGVHGGGMPLWQDLKNRGWPQKDYTVLCWNCNCSGSRGRLCPHKRLPEDVAGFATTG